MEIALSSDTTPINPERILFVDDDEILRSMVTESCGGRFDITAVSTFEQGLAHIRTEAYDVLLVDVVLGSHSGIDLVRALQAQAPHTPAIMITAYANLDMALSAMELGVMAFLQKPFRLEMLESALDKAISRCRMDRCRNVFNRYLERSNAIYRQAIADAVVEQRKLFLSTLSTLTQAIDARDAYTGKHSIAVGTLARNLASAAGLESDEIRDAETAGLLHDIGKIAISETILCKPAALSTEEFAIMREHPDRAIDILRALPDMEQVIAAIHTHHERVDGMGYPRRLAGKNIPVLGRILTICDAWDAMTSDRPYRQAMTPTQAERVMIDCRGTQFDPEYLDLFLATHQSCA